MINTLAIQLPKKNQKLGTLATKNKKYTSNTGAEDSTRYLGVGKHPHLLNYERSIRSKAMQI